MRPEALLALGDEVAHHRPPLEDRDPLFEEAPAEFRGRFKNHTRRSGPAAAPRLRSKGLAPGPMASYAAAPRYRSFR